MIATLVSTAVGLAKDWMEGRQRDRKLRAELKDKRLAEEAKSQRALIKRSSLAMRVASFALLIAPFLAPAAPGVEISDVQKYFDEAIAAVPDWWIGALQAAYAAIWAGAEAGRRRALGEERRVGELDAEAQQALNKTRERQRRQREAPDTEARDDLEEGLT